MSLIKKTTIVEEEYYEDGKLSKRVVTTTEEEYSQDSFPLPYNPIIPHYQPVTTNTPYIIDNPYVTTTTCASGYISMEENDVLIKEEY